MESNRQAHLPTNKRTTPPYGYFVNERDSRTILDNIKKTTSFTRKLWQIKKEEILRQRRMKSDQLRRIYPESRKEFGSRPGAYGSLEDN